MTIGPHTFNITLRLAMSRGKDSLRMQKGYEGLETKYLRKLTTIRPLALTQLSPINAL